MSAQPQASVIIPMRNAKRYIGATLDSILCENVGSVEVIVVDDRSSDGSAEVVVSRRDERIRLVPGPGEGIPTALNVGLAAVRGSIVMRCDADDLYAPQRIRRQLSWLERHPAYGAVCGDIWVIDDRGRLVAELSGGRGATDITEELLEGRTRTHLGTFAVRTEIARKLRGFRPFFVTAEDTDFQLRLAELASVMYLPEQWYGYRLHGDSVTHSPSGDGRIYYYDRCARFLREQRKVHGTDDLDRGCEPTVPPEDDAAHHVTDDHILDLITGAAWQAHAGGEKAHAIRIALRAFRYARLNRRVWWNLAALVLKPARVATP